MTKIKKYVLDQLDDMTFWLGICGLIVWSLLPKSWLLLFFLLMIFMSDIQLSNLIAKGSKAVRDALDK
jgi:hypothetical protein